MAAPLFLIGQTDLDFSGLVRYVRVELGLTQSEFGALFGVRYETVSSWENGHKLPPLYKQRLIQAAECAVHRHGIMPWDIARSMELGGPAYALWCVLDKAYRPDA